MSVKVEHRRRTISRKEQIKQISQVLKEYLGDRINIAQAAEKIVDILHPWEVRYAPLLAYHMDPWAERARDILAVEDVLAVCGDIVFGEEYADINPYPRNDEGYIQCVLDALFSSSETD